MTSKYPLSADEDQNTWGKVDFELRLFGQQQQNLFHSSLLISDFPCSKLVFMLSSLMILQNLPWYVTKAVINNVHCSLNNSQHHRAREEKRKKKQNKKKIQFYQMTSEFELICGERDFTHSGLMQD